MAQKKVKDQVRDILEKDDAVTCGIVVVEILRGAKDDRLFKTLKETLPSLRQTQMNDEVIEKAAQWGYTLDRKGNTVSTTDLFIAAAASDKAVVLHIDSDFEIITSLGLRQEKLAIS
jgi:predicted nucleic acid-binding protein